MFRIAEPGGFVDALTPDDLPLLADTSGVAVVLRDGVRSVGTTPSVATLCAIAKWLQSGDHDAYATDSFSDDAPDVLDAEGVAALLAVAVLRELGEYLLWFRPRAQQSSASWTPKTLESAALVRGALLAKARHHSFAELGRVLDEQRKLDEFFAVVGHELRNSMNVIGGWVTLLRSEAIETEQQRRGLDIIEKNVRVQRKIVDDLVDASRLARGKLALELERLDVLALVEDVLASCLPALEQRRIVLERLLDDDLGSIRGDAERLRQVLGNIVGNAVKFTAPGGTIRVRGRRAGALVELSVTDSGVGISKDFLPHVFDAFRQAGSSRTRERTTGLGLGLTIAKHLVGLHGGEIVAESPGPGLGATFRVLLPLAP
ncbi:MAG TPA: ATP-binding protein [Polyangiaceae bacterium]